MQTEDKKRVAETLTEKAIKIKVGIFTFRIKPLTLAQIYELGAVVNAINIDDIENEDKINVFATTLEHFRDARIMNDVFTVCAFRKPWKRRLFRKYIYNHLTLGTYGEFMSVLMQSLNANFFLTSIIFLRRTTTMTESQTTHRGQQSEE